MEEHLGSVSSPIKYSFLYFYLLTIKVGLYKDWLVFDQRCVIKWTSVTKEAFLQSQYISYFTFF